MVQHTLSNSLASSVTRCLSDRCCPSLSSLLLLELSMMRSSSSGACSITLTGSSCSFTSCAASLFLLFFERNSGGCTYGYEADGAIADGAAAGFLLRRALSETEAAVTLSCLRALRFALCCFLSSFQRRCWPSVCSSSLSWLGCSSLLSVGWTVLLLCVPRVRRSLSSLSSMTYAIISLCCLNSRPAVSSWLFGASEERGEGEEEEGSWRRRGREGRELCDLTVVVIGQAAVVDDDELRPVLLLTVGLGGRSMTADGGGERVDLGLSRERAQQGKGIER